MRVAGFRRVCAHDCGSAEPAQNHACTIQAVSAVCCTACAIGSVSIGRRSPYVARPLTLLTCAYVLCRTVWYTAHDSVATPTLRKNFFS